MTEPNGQPAAEAQPADAEPRDVLVGEQLSPEEYGQRRAEQARQAAQPGPQGVNPDPGTDQPGQ